MSSTRISYHIHAPRAIVYRALLDPRPAAKWKVPDGMTCVVHEFDGRGRLVLNEQVVEMDEFETDDSMLRSEMTITSRLADA